MTEKQSCKLPGRNESECTVPSKILTRKEGITRDFLELLNSHVEDILAARIDYMFRIKDFAKHLNIHPTHFSNTIKLTTGKSPCDFVEERITNEAKLMLQNRSVTIREICYKLAFNDPTKFTKFL